MYSLTSVADDELFGLSVSAVPEILRRSYALGRQGGRLAAELDYLVRAAFVRGLEPFDYKAYLAGLGKQPRYGSVRGFVRSYFFDRRNGESLRCSADRFAQNVTALQKALGPSAVRQAGQALSVFERAAVNVAPALALQKTCDCLEAFLRAACMVLPPMQGDAVESGRLVERLRVALATDAKKPAIWQDLEALLTLADRTALPLDLSALYRLQVQGQLLAKNGRFLTSKEELRAAVETVFRV